MFYCFGLKPAVYSMFCLLPLLSAPNPTYPLPCPSCPPHCLHQNQSAMKKVLDELLEFICGLAKGDTEGMMANKVLEMLWTLAKQDDCPPDTMDHALNAHLKILDSSAQVRVCSTRE